MEPRTHCVAQPRHGQCPGSCALKRSQPSKMASGEEAQTWRLLRTILAVSAPPSSISAVCQPAGNCWTAAVLDARCREVVGVKVTGNARPCGRKVWDTPYCGAICEEAPWQCSGRRCGVVSRGPWSCCGRRRRRRRCVVWSHVGRGAAVAGGGVWCGLTWAVELLWEEEVWYGLTWAVELLEEVCGVVSRGPWRCWRSRRSVVWSHVGRGAAVGGGGGGVWCGLTWAVEVLEEQEVCDVVSRGQWSCWRRRSVVWSHVGRGAAGGGGGGVWCGLTWAVELLEEEEEEEDCGVVSRGPWSCCGRRRRSRCVVWSHVGRGAAVAGGAGVWCGSSPLVQLGLRSALFG
ncbi:uncharacterized protein [Oryctolagus cuniculus]|uniref:uncharacterized protein n=1 Tax=Oryctolagus cuniculus TaxID=9986 RepID=UPI0038798D6C